MTPIRTKRVYDDPAPGDGRRVLVDRVWPRGRTRESLHLDAWIKDVAPSTDLRKWFDHRAERWNEFRERYFHELAADPEGLRTLRELAGEGTLTLLYSARDRDHNQAVALREFLEKGE